MTCKAPYSSPQEYINQLVNLENSPGTHFFLSPRSQYVISCAPLSPSPEALSNPSNRWAGPFNHSIPKMKVVVNTCSSTLLIHSISINQSLPQCNKHKFPMRFSYPEVIFPNSSHLKDPSAHSSGRTLNVTQVAK
ncbi:hypothetical protein TNCT_191611 [Trichonephila clavata]|uniref:Uncharacterized protein n=1 Tax=Trichonephila clavata TaxID=2740835 RepID=A0A8X6M1K1_TRICU|nr:hypothetical protein TNCT_191611 [Trichonephila clavata]